MKLRSENQIASPPTLRSLWLRVTKILLAMVIGVGLQLLFNAQLPLIFPELPAHAAYRLSLGATLIFALLGACGLPALGMLGLVGLMAGRALDAYFFIADGAAYPSLMCKVLTVAAQGGGLLLGSLIDYIRWLRRTLRRLLM